MRNVHVCHQDNSSNIGKQMNQIVSSTEFNGTAYFYPDATNILGSIEKDDCKSIMVSVDYSKLGIFVSSASFTVDTQTNPYLSVTTPTVTNNILTFVLSGGLEGMTYELAISPIPSSRTDILTVNVPEDICCSNSKVNSFNVISPSGPTIYINGAVRYFISNTPPTNANVMDQWFYPPTATLYEYITDGGGVNFWWAQIPYYGVPGTPVGKLTLFQEQLNVSGVNAVSPLSNTPSGPVTLFVNREAFSSIEVPASFTMVGLDVVWNATNAKFSLIPGYTTVIASYAG